MAKTPASDAYSQSTFVLTRSFVERACTNPPIDFAAEIRTFAQSGLRHVVEEMKLLIAESEKAETQQGGAVPTTQSEVVAELKVLSATAVVGLRGRLAGHAKLLG